MSLRLTLPTHIRLNPDKHAAAFGRYHANRRLRAALPQAGTFDFPTRLVGTSSDGNVTVLYDPALGQSGADLADHIFASAGTTYSDSQAFFNVAGLPVNVIIAAISGATDGSGGAYHYGCNFNPGSDLYCDVAFGNPNLTNGLVVAELTESVLIGAAELDVPLAVHLAFGANWADAKG